MKDAFFPSTAVIMLAGVGTRMGSLTDNTHKSLLLIGDHPLLFYSVQMLIDLGVKEFLVVVGGQKEKIKEYLDQTFPLVTKTYIENPRHKTTNTLYSYYLVREHIRDKAFIRQDGDSLYEPEILKRLINPKEQVTVAISRKKKNIELPEYKVKLDDDQKHIALFSKKLTNEEADGTGLAVEFVSQKASTAISDELGAIPPLELEKQYAEDVYTSYRKKKIKPVAVDCGDLRWYELDTPEDLRLIRNSFTPDDFSL